MGSGMQHRERVVEVPPRSAPAVDEHDEVATETNDGRAPPRRRGDSRRWSRIRCAPSSSRRTTARRTVRDVPHLHAVFGSRRFLAQESAARGSPQRSRPPATPPSHGTIERARCCEPPRVVCPARRRRPRPPGRSLDSSRAVGARSRPSPTTTTGRPTSRIRCDGGQLRQRRRGPAAPRPPSSPTRAWRSRRNSRRRCDASEASRWAHRVRVRRATGRALPRARQALPPRLPPAARAAATGESPAQTPPTTEDTHGHLRTLRTRTANPPPSNSPATGAAHPPPPLLLRREKAAAGRSSLGSWFICCRVRGERVGVKRNGQHAHGRRLPHVP